MKEMKFIATTPGMTVLMRGAGLAASLAPPIIQLLAFDSELGGWASLPSERAPLLPIKSCK